MKKSLIILAILATALSCAKEASVKDSAEKTSNANLQEMSFTASFEADTKAVLNNDRSVSFAAGDRVAVFANGNKYEFTTAEGGANATFTGTGEAAATYYILYPYSDDATIDEGTITNVNLGTSDVASTPGTFAPQHAIFVAKTTSTSFVLKSAVALLKLTVPAEITDLKEVAIFNRQNTSAPFTGAITGTFNVTPGDSAPVVEVTAKNGASGDPHTTGIVAPTGDALASGDYYIPVLPSVLTKGLDMKLTFKGTDVLGAINGRVARGGEFTFEAGKVYNLGTVYRMAGYVYNSFESGSVNETITGGNTSSVSVVDNPLVNGNNSSSKVMKLDMTTRPEESATSGVIKLNPINTVRFPQTWFRTFFTGVRIKFYSAGDVYCPYFMVDADQGKGYSEIRPNRVNGTTISSEDDFNAAYVTDDWNVLEWDYSSIGVSDNSKKQNIANIQFRLFVNYSKTSQSRPTKQLLGYVDDIVFFY